MFDPGNNRRLKETRPMVWAFIPYSLEDGHLCGQTYDNPETKIELASVFEELGLRWVWQPVLLGHVEELVNQVGNSRAHHPSVVFNFCDGVEHWGTPGITVVQALERECIPFTGAASRFYDISTSKVPMKDLFVRAGVDTAPYALLPNEGGVSGVCDKLGPPLFVKPSISAASEGISLKSKVTSDAEVAARRDELLQSKDGEAYSKGGIFVERFLDGDEYTVFVGGFWDRPESIWNLPPARRAFAESIPAEERFLSYDRYWGFYKEETPPAGNENFYRYVPAPPSEEKELVDQARRAYCAVEGSGYGRVDFRRDRSTGKLHCLEVNANCGLSGNDQTSTGCILHLSGIRFSQLLGKIIDQALERYSGS
jgi:D-alanine-D-alanine ligase